ncbi:hypothetical protein [Caulobacter mirabilis]|nr:hypothetical protein [Caulobacter mirabilis]
MTRPALLAGAALVVTGCTAIVELEPGVNAPVDATSPAAKAVVEAVQNPGPWPTFADIPEIPADVRESAAWRADIAAQQAEGASTVAAAGPDSWSLNATDAFARRAKDEAAAIAVHAPTAAEIAESEAYARALRKRATPPSSPR